MFLKDLNQTQKEVFMGLAERIVLADWSMKEGEEKALNAVKAQIGEVDVQPGDIFGNNRVDCFDDEKTKRGIMYELLLLVHADQSVHESESHAIGDLTKSMRMDPQVVEELDSIARRHAMAVFVDDPVEALWAHAREIVEAG